MDYGLITIKFVLGMICLIFQINILGKGNLAPTSAIDQVQNYVLGELLVGSFTTKTLQCSSSSWFC